MRLGPRGRAAPIPSRWSKAQGRQTPLLSAAFDVRRGAPRCLLSCPAQRSPITALPRRRALRAVVPDASPGLWSCCGAAPTSRTARWRPLSLERCGMAASPRPWVPPSPVPIPHSAGSPIPEEVRMGAGGAGAPHPAHIRGRRWGSVTDTGLGAQRIPVCPGMMGWTGRDGEQWGGVGQADVG